MDMLVHEQQEELQVKYQEEAKHYGFFFLILHCFATNLTL